MPLLEELATNKETLNVDFHNHLQTGSSFREENPKGFFNRISGEGFTDLSKLLDKIMTTDLDVIYITNFSDSRAEDWTSEEQLEIAIQSGYEIEQGDYYTFAKKDDRIIALGKSQEVPTNQGHALFAGLSRDKRFSDNNSLDDSLEEATDNELKISDHHYTRIEKSGTLARSEDPEQDAKKFDALERNGNFYLPFLSNWKTLRAGKRYNKPVVANSDGHHPKDIGKTYNILDPDSLDYNSERDFRDSINEQIIQGNYKTQFRPIPPWRIFHHAFMLAVYAIGKKLHLISDDAFEKYSND